MTNNFNIDKFVEFYKEGNQINPLLIDLLFILTEKKIGNNGYEENCNIEFVDNLVKKNYTPSSTPSRLTSGLSVPSVPSSSTDPFINFINKIDVYIKSFSLDTLMIKADFFLDSPKIETFDGGKEIISVCKNDSTKILDNKTNLLDSKRITKAVAGDFEQKKQFYDINTDFISSEKIFQDKNQELIFKFQYLVNTFFIYFFEKYKVKMGLSSKSIYFLYKGGTFMKILFEKYKGILKTNDDFFKTISDMFKRSDSDYQIIISPDIDNYNLHYYNMNVIAYNILQKINSFIQSNISDILPLNQITMGDLEKQLGKMNKHLQDNKANLQYFEPLDKFIGIQCFDKIFMNETIPDGFKYYKLIPGEKKDADDVLYPAVFDAIMQKEKKVSIKRKNFYITPKEDKGIIRGSVGIINSDELDSGIYQYFNETNRFSVETVRNQNYLTYFGLHRAKINFILYFKTKNNSYGYFKCPSELIDISIGTSTDYKKNFDIGKSINQYSNVLQGKQLLFYSYTIYGIITDIYKAIYYETSYPWDDKKYAKKIKRISFFLVIHLNNIYKNYNDILINIKKFLRNFNINLIENTNLVTYGDVTVKGKSDELFYSFFKNIVDVKKSVDDDKSDAMKENFKNMIDTIISIVEIFKPENTNYKDETPEKVNFLNKYLKYKQKYLQLKKMSKNN
jgi:hypothetical protein